MRNISFLVLMFFTSLISKAQEFDIIDFNKKAENKTKKKEIMNLY